MPTIAQILLVFAAILAFAIGGGMSATRAWTDHPMPRLLARILLVCGILVCAAVIIWHSIATSAWLPIGDTFASLVWLAGLLSLFVLYVQRHRQLGSLDWYVMPVVILLLVAAAIFGRAEVRADHPAARDVWLLVHYITSFGGALAFTIAAAGGAMYVTASKRLRSKSPVGPQFGSLERLEHLTMTSATLGFALLTVGMITGGVQIFAEGKHTPIAKIILAVGVWLIYAVVLHAPMNPSFRGRKVAVLSVVGFVLMLGVLVTSLLIPAAKG